MKIRILNKISNSFFFVGLIRHFRPELEARMAKFNQQNQIQQ